jgi:hypothetical protein
MAEGHVGKFVGHHARELRFVVRGFDGTAIDEDETAGQRECVYGLVVHAVKFLRIVNAAGIQMLGETLAELGEISIDLGVVAHGHFLLDFAGSLSP